VSVVFAGKGHAVDRATALADLLPSGVEGAWLEQIHSADVKWAAPGANGPGDALVTGLPGLALAVVTADCLPVLLAGPSRVAAVHAGWRGLVADIIPRTIELMGETPLFAWIGPAICGRRYEVGDDVAARIACAGAATSIRPGPRGRPLADLPQAASTQLERAGVAQIHRLDLCTFESPGLLWSYRRDGAAAGRNLALIWRNP
jgi:polyphenol oxidase